MSSLLRRQLLRSESHFSEHASRLLTEDVDSSSEDDADAGVLAEHGLLRHVVPEAEPTTSAADTDPPQPEARQDSRPVTPSTPTTAQALKERKHGTTWKATAAVLLADMFGLGTLTLPADYARLGWVVGLMVTLLSACGLIFSGVLFTRLSLLVPRAQTFADYGDAAFGRRGRRMVYAAVYICIALEPVILQLICTQNLVQVLHRYNISQLTAGIAIAVFMVPLSQIQTLEEISWLAYAGTVGMLVGVGIVFGKLIALPARAHHMTPVQTRHPRAAVTAFLDIVFTFGGQVNWVRYVSGMKRRSDFKYSAAFAGVFMTVIYIALGLYGYYILGTDFDFEQPVSSIFESDIWIILMNVGILVHCIIAYQINLNVWTDMVLHLFTDGLETREERSSRHGRRVWGMLTTLGIVYSLAISQVVPYFSLVMAIIAAVGDLTAAYALPALFCLKLSGPRLPLPRWQALVCYGLIPVAVALSGVGLASSLTDLYQKLAHRFL